MALTLYLAKVLGVYLLVTGAALLVRRGYFIPVLGAFVEERSHRMIIGLLELLAGLALVMAHLEWSSPAATIISVIGIMTALEGFMYLVVADETIEKYIKMFNVQAWYIAGGLLAIVMGAYLALYGFAFI